MENSKEFYSKYIGKTIYLKNELENAVIKSDPDTGNYVKFAGGVESKVELGNAIVADALLLRKLISQQEYNSF